MIILVILVIIVVTALRDPDRRSLLAPRPSTAPAALCRPDLPTHIIPTQIA